MPLTLTRINVGAAPDDGNGDNARVAGQTLNANMTATETEVNAKADLVGGVIPTAQLPALAIVEYLGEAANQAAMLALTGQKGDWTIRTDTATVWVITGDDPTLLADWTELEYPAAPVTSVNSQSGAVVLGAADVGAATAAQGATADAALPRAGGNLTGDVTADVGVLVDGRDLSVDGSKLDAIEDNATADQTGAEIKALYEAEADTNAFTDAEQTKLGHIAVTQAVDLDAIETRVNALDAAIVLQGTWDASAGTFPGGGTAQAGDSYIVSVPGTVDGVAFAANDRIIAITDNASTAIYAANWHKADYTDEVLSVAGLTGAITASGLRTAINVEDGATADQSDAEIATAYQTEVPLISQADAEAGVATAIESWSALRVAQAIAALGGGGSSSAADLTWASGTQSEKSDSATVIAFDFDTDNALSTAGAKLVSLKNNGAEKAYFDKDGGLVGVSPSFYKLTGTKLYPNGTTEMYITNDVTSMALFVTGSKRVTITNNTTGTSKFSGATTASLYLSPAHVQFPDNSSHGNIGMTPKQADQTVYDLSIFGQDALAGASTNVNGGNVDIIGGASATGSGNGGDVTIRGGPTTAGSAGDVVMDTLPTSDPLKAGALWDDGGIIKRSTGV